ncbi:hypothetical protein LPJ63_003453 [Coemansia sp. RSA 2711]|nr:hypothetical protein LPJ63_003453 [Coemansia sp. RSA 2711]KAJ2297272.1 hypothetical protein IWW54_006809 [Coemansia sp. RSA 2705]
MPTLSAPPPYVVSEQQDSTLLPTLPPRPTIASTASAVSLRTYHAVNEPVRLHLINPARPQSGFSMALPERLHTLGSHPVNTQLWREFITKLNEMLARAPGALAQGVTGFWLTQLATLGISTLAQRMYTENVFHRAMEVVETYNLDQFAALGIVARLREVKGEPLPEMAAAATADCSSEKSKKRRFKWSKQTTLMLIIEQA